jgi:uroporphyrin-3 C-methyltransferase
VTDPTDPKSQEEVSEAALFESRSDDSADAPVSDDASPVDEPSPAAPAKPRSGRLLASLALLVALAALALAGYQYYLQQFTNPLAPVSSRLDSIELEARELASSVSGLETSQAEALAQFASKQRLELEAERTALLDSLNQVASQAPPSSREWKVAEVGYLLRIANHRLLMERDVDGAIKMLSAADQILVELDDFAYYQVRARLAEEIRALELVETSDLPGIYLELEAMKRELRQLPLKLPQYLEGRRQAEGTPQSAEEGFWDGLRREFSDKFRIRSFEGNIKPLLSPEEAVYLELNLRLMLERAQLAALRRQQLVFSESLMTAASWLQEYLDQSDESVARATGELERIAAIQLDQDLPDISGSLTALTSVRPL